MSIPTIWTGITVNAETTPPTRLDQGATATGHVVTQCLLLAPNKGLASVAALLGILLSPVQGKLGSVSALALLMKPHTPLLHMATPGETGHPGNTNFKVQ